MIYNKVRFYIFILIADLIGFIWLFININSDKLFGNIELCLLKRFTSIPCPSCGSTRSVELLFHGKFLDAILLNPFGILLAIIMIISPLWIISDFLLKKYSFLNFYYNIENLFKNKYVAIIGIIIVLLNWIWNINKGL